MRIDHAHAYTEQHRFYVYRDFSLSALDRRMLMLAYQPMVGAAAIGLYYLLYHQLSEDVTGYSRLEQQRKLFLGAGVDMNDAGRRQLAGLASRLEAVGLLQVSKLAAPHSDELCYEYELGGPLRPDDFFGTHHLSLFLRDQVGKYALIAIREQLYAPEPDELAEAQLQKQNISVPFYELFRLNAKAADEELEQALQEVAPARAAKTKQQQPTAGITYGDVIMRFPRNSDSRLYVEQLRGNDEAMAEINYTAYKYELNAADICRLLDEDGIFSKEGALLLEELQKRAAQLYRQDRKRTEERAVAASRASRAGTNGEQPEEEQNVSEEYYLAVPELLAGKCDIAQYNMLMRNEPYTRFIRRFFPGTVPVMFERLFERFDASYQLQEPVINVLVHYIFGMNQPQRLTQAFIESVASNMLTKRIDSFEKAVLYVREQTKLEERRRLEQDAPRPGGRSYGGGSYGNRGGRAPQGRAGGGKKPDIPIVEKGTGSRKLSAEELEAARRLADELEEEGS